MKHYTENITREAGKIEEEIRKSNRQLELVIRKAQDVLKAPDVVIRDEQAERASPIGSFDNDYDRAVEAVCAGSRWG